MTYFRPSRFGLSAAKRGASHKKTDESAGGMEELGVGVCEEGRRERGQMSRRHDGEKHTVFHQPPEKNVIRNSADAAADVDASY